MTTGLLVGNDNSYFGRTWLVNRSRLVVTDMASATPY